MQTADRRTTISVSAEHMDRIRMVAAEATMLNGGRRISIQTVTDAMIEHALARLGAVAATFIVTSQDEESPVIDE